MNYVKNIKAKPACVLRACYTMATTNGEDGEIVMYGEIIEERPIDPWTGQPEYGNFIIQSEFLEDLQKLARVKRLTVRLNCVGGDAFVAIAIHNRLRELPADVTVVVDGVAMSGGSLIMCAADRVLVNPSSLIMVHQATSRLMGSYNQNELRHIVTSLHSVDMAQLAIYKRKTGLSDDALLSMMADETFMTGNEALEKGFADDLLDEQPINIAASADRKTWFVEGWRVRFSSPCAYIPDFVPTMSEEDAENAEPPQASSFVKDGADVRQRSPKVYWAADPTLKEAFTDMKMNFSRKNPETVSSKDDSDTNGQAILPERQAIQTAGHRSPDGQGMNGLAPDMQAIRDAVRDAVAAEQLRIREIDAVAALYDAATVQEAKYGDKACSAQEMTYRAALAGVRKRNHALFYMETDADLSGADKVSPAVAPPAEDLPLSGENLMAKARADAKAMRKDSD